MRTYLIGAAVAATLSLPAHASTLVSYISTNSPGSIAATFADTGVTGFDLSRGAGITQNVSGFTYNSKGWTENNLADAMAADDFLQFGFTSVNSYNLSSLDIRYDRSGTGPMQIDLWASADGGAFSSIYTDASIGLNGENNTIDLSAFAGVSSLTFQLFGWSAGNQGTFDIENAASFGGNGIRINGALAPVPLPAGLPMLLGALGLMGYLRRRKAA
jgi:hypothetical protein